MISPERLKETRILLSKEAALLATSVAMIAIEKMCFVFDDLPLRLMKCYARKS